MKSNLTLPSIATHVPEHTSLAMRPDSDSAYSTDSVILDDAMSELSQRSPTLSHSSFKMTEGDTKLPLLTRARIAALSQHLVTAAAHISIFALARVSESLDAAANHKTLKLEHVAASTGTGVLGVTTALDALAAAVVFCNRAKSASDIKDTQWLPTLTNLSETLRPYAKHVRTLQNGVTNLALFGAVSSAGALWATRQSINDAPPPMRDDINVSPTPEILHAPSTSNALECAQLVAGLVSSTVRALMPPIVATCVNRDEAKRKRHRYDVAEGPQPETEGPVESIRFTALGEAPHSNVNWA